MNDQSEHRVARCQPEWVCAEWGFGEGMSGGFVERGTCVRLCNEATKDVAYINHDTRTCKSGFEEFKYYYKLDLGAAQLGAQPDISGTYQRYVDAGYKTLYIGVARCANYENVYDTYEARENGQFECVPGCSGESSLRREERDGYLCVERSLCAGIVYSGMCLAQCQNGTLRFDGGGQPTCVTPAECGGDYEIDHELGACVARATNTQKALVGIAVGAVVAVLAVVVLLVVMMILRKKRRDRRRKNRKGKRGN